MKIDVFNHVLPPKLLDGLGRFLPSEPIKRWYGITTIHDVEARVRMLEQFDDYQQIICLSLADPGLEELCGPKDAAELARLGNDGMAAMVARHPDRIPAFVATVPMNDEKLALAEIDRAVGDLNACGIEIHSNVAGKPLDLPEFFPIFARMAELDKPIWLHPCRSMSFADYTAEDVSKYDIFWALGWAYETSAAMVRIALSGMLEKLPGLKVICHHWGGYIPHMEGRIPATWEMIGGHVTGGSISHTATVKCPRPPIDYFKMFYGDTALFGALPASQAGLDFFGAEHSLFASDAPFDAEGGAIKIRQSLGVMEKIRCSEADKQKIYEGNIRRMVPLG